MDQRTIQLRHTAVRTQRSTLYNLATFLGAISSICTVVPSNAHGHGTPALVGVLDGKLTVAGNLANPIGFADAVLAETDADSPFTTINGDRLFTDFPGFDVSGVFPGDELWLTPAVVPYATMNDVEDRILWYWSPDEQTVTLAPNDQTLNLVSARGFGQITLAQLESVPTAVQIMEPLASDLGQHRHPLYYILDDSPPAAIGAYGFFARLTSPAHESSDAFLIALNNGLNASEFVEAALQINLAAAGLPGDYHVDGVVDAADYAVWQSSFGTSVTIPLEGADGDGNGLVDGGDFLVWQRQYQGPLEGVGKNASTAATGVPEPESVVLVVAALMLAYGFRLHNRQHHTACDDL